MQIDNEVTCWRNLVQGGALLPYRGCSKSRDCIELNTINLFKHFTLKKKKLYSVF